MNQLICPNCNANIEADSIQLFVYCRYCGTKIQTRDIVEVRYVQEAESLEKMVADGDTYLKVEEYYLAEQKFREVIRQYPDRCEGYDGLIRALTKDGTVFPLMHETEVFGLLYEAERLAPEAEKIVLAAKREKMREAFEAERIQVDSMSSDDVWKREEERRASIKAIKIIFGSFLAMSALVFVTLDFSIGWPVGLMLFSVSAYLFCSAWKN